MDEVERVARAIWEKLSMADKPYDLLDPSQIYEIHQAARAAIEAVRRAGPETHSLSAGVSPAGPVHPTNEREIKEWRARETVAFALYPILDREGCGMVSAGELADAAITTFQRVMDEPLPEAWRKYVE